MSSYTERKVHAQSQAKIAYNNRLYIFKHSDLPIRSFVVVFIRKKLILIYVIYVFLFSSMSMTNNLLDSSSRFEKKEWVVLVSLLTSSFILGTIVSLQGPLYPAEVISITYVLYLY